MNICQLPPRLKVVLNFFVNLKCSLKHKKKIQTIFDNLCCQTLNSNIDLVYQLFDWQLF